MTAQVKIEEDRDRALAMILEGFCPYCGKGPFRSPVGHVARAHGVNRRQVRDDLGIFYKVSLTAPDFHEEIVARARTAWKGMGHHSGYTKTLSRAAMRLQKEKSGMLSNEVRAQVGRKNSARRLAEARERDAEIVRLFRDGLLCLSIAEQVGIHPRTVGAVLRRNGYDPTQNRVAASRGKYTTQLALGHELYRQRMAQETAALVAEYQTGMSVYAMAQTRGTTVKSLRSRLRYAGVDVPDGRADPERPKTPRPKGEPWYCQVEGCDRVGRCRGLCGMHYQRWKKAGTL